MATRIRVDQFKDFDETTEDVIGTSMSGVGSVSVFYDDDNDTILISGSVSSVVTPVLSVDYQVSGMVGPFTAGESVSALESCYFKSDGKLWKSSASSASTMPIVALSTASISGDSSGEFLLQGFARKDSWDWTVGGMIYADTISGSLTQTIPDTIGDRVQVVGWAYSADIMYFNPNYAMVEIA